MLILQNPDNSFINQENSLNVGEHQECVIKISEKSKDLGKVT